jgi:hypothetical protein
MSNIQCQKVKYVMSKGEIWGNDHLIEFHLTFSVDRKFLLIKAFDQISLDLFS